MPQDATHRPAHEHPIWCARRFTDHDLHRSAIERIAADVAYAALEFHDPATGPEPVTFQLTFTQLRHLGEALNRLVKTGGQPGPAGAAAVSAVR
jgi:hypothetical protein